MKVSTDHFCFYLSAHHFIGYRLVPSVFRVTQFGSFMFRKDAKDHEGLQSYYSLRSQLTADLAQKQLDERLKMPSVWFRFISFPPEAMQGPDCAQSISLSGGCVPFGVPGKSFKLPGWMFEWLG